MAEITSMDVCKTYLDCQVKCSEGVLKRKNERAVQPFVTISRQTGAGGITVGENLIKFLREHDQKATCPWTVFDKNLIQVVLKEHDLPASIEKYMPEQTISESKDWLEELFDLHPSEWTLVHKTSETILHLAKLGDVVLMGRGANLITKQLKSGFHVRLIGSLEKRIKHAADYYQLSQAKAAKFVDQEDKGRKNYLKKHFDQNIDDPLIYDLILNTDRISCEDAAHIIGEEVLQLREKIRCGLLPL